MALSLKWKNETMNPLLEIIKILFYYLLQKLLPRLFPSSIQLKHYVSEETSSFLRWYYWKSETPAGLNIYTPSNQP
jgi:hypothetical protein